MKEKHNSAVNKLPVESETSDFSLEFPRAVIYCVASQTQEN